jgi:hypothetical protein
MHQDKLGHLQTLVAMTHKYVFDYQDGDIYWCSADVGWVTGHSYIVYLSSTLFSKISPTFVGSKVGVGKLNARYYKDGSEILIQQEGSNPRKLTPREAARLQGFPENFKIPVSNTQAYRQFGNSVPVKVIEKVAEHLEKSELTLHNLVYRVRLIGVESGYHDTGNTS